MYDLLDYVYLYSLLLKMLNHLFGNPPPQLFVILYILEATHKYSL